MLRKLYDRLERTLPDHPWALLAAIFAFCAVAVVAIVDPRTGEPNLFLDSSLDSLLPDEDEGRIFYERLKDTLDGDRGGFEKQAGSPSAVGADVPGLL